MCRLYGFLANEPTKVECALVHAQNALMAQSRKDRSGESHLHGWGVATYENGLPRIERQAWAAYHGEHFRRAAARAYARTVIAHVRAATVGPPALDNTHPFTDGPWSFVHNGTIPAFHLIRAAMLAAMPEHHRGAIRGDTDSEHLFHFILSHHEQQPARPLEQTVRAAVHQVLAWSRAAAPSEAAGLNIILTDGARLVGTRWGRTLFYLERQGLQPCDICGVPHVAHQPGRTYRSVEVASEPITDEPWLAVTEPALYSVTPTVTLSVEPL
jgi:predicted glutamine amidotransferase